jgi:leucine efflux protein
MIAPASFGIENLTAFLMTSALVIFAPGPANMYIASQACRSVRQGIWGLAGIISGDIFLIFLSGIGFSALLAKWPSLLWIIKLVGAVYIAWIGWKMLRTKPSTAVQPEVEDVFSGGGFHKGLLLTAMNPKLILFFGAFFPMFVSAATQHRWGSFMVLGVMFQVLNVFYYGALIWLVSHFRHTRLMHGRGKQILTQLSGVGLLLCAAFVFIESSS